MARKVERRRVLNFLISKRKQEEKFLQSTEKFLAGIRSEMVVLSDMGFQPWEMEELQKQEREGMTAKTEAERDIRRYNEAINIVETYLAEQGVL